MRWGCGEGSNGAALHVRWATQYLCGCTPQAGPARRAGGCGAPGRASETCGRLRRADASCVTQHRAASPPPPSALPIAAMSSLFPACYRYFEPREATAGCPVARGGGSMEEQRLQQLQVGLMPAERLSCSPRASTSDTGAADTLRRPYKGLAGAAASLLAPSRTCRHPLRPSAFPLACRRSSCSSSSASQGFTCAAAPLRSRQWRRFQSPPRRKWRHVPQQVGSLSSERFPPVCHQPQPFCTL